MEWALFLLLDYVRINVQNIGSVLGWVKWMLTYGIRARHHHARLGGFLGGCDVRGCMTGGGCLSLVPPRLQK
jgi:hypothetical protein